VYVDGTQLFTAQASNRVFLGLVSQDTQNRVERLQKTIAKTSDDAARTQEALKKYVGQLQEFRNQLGAALTAGRTLPAVPTPPAFTAPSAVAAVSLPSIQTTSIVHVLFNPDLKTSWVMVPGLIGLILTLIGTVVTSIGLVRERESGTLEQLAVMPLRPASIIMGKIVPYFILALMDMLIITVLGIWLFKVPFVGSVPIFALGVALFLFVVLGLGVMISSLSQTTGQAIQMALMITMPQILLSGLIFPLSSMAAGVRWIGYVLPLTWFIVVSQGVMLRGAELSSLWIALTILAAQAVVIFGAATLRMRRLLTHGGSR
jgi:ABC-2 type transport system permease protein